MLGQPRPHLAGFSRLGFALLVLMGLAIVAGLVTLWLVPAAEALR